MMQALDSAPAAMHDKTGAAMHRVLPVVRSNRELADQSARVDGKVGPKRPDGGLRIGRAPVPKITELHDGPMACTTAGGGDLHP